MKRISCPKADKMIVTNLDEGLPLKQQAVLNGHLRECPRCRQLNEQTQVLLSTLREDVHDNPAEEFWTRFETTLQVRLQDLDGRTRWLFPWVKVGIVAAAAVLLLAIGFKTLIPRKPQYAMRPPSTGMIVQELYAVYGPLSEDSVTVDYDPGESNYHQTFQYLSEDEASQLFDGEDAPVQVVL